jgi:aspartate kinase
LRVFRLRRSSDIVVMKFGGSSLASMSGVRAAARRMVATQRRGHQVVGVVSAMASTTDNLIQLARDILAKPPARELDLITSTGEVFSAALTAMAVRALGTPALALTGGQAGIHTDDTFGAARVLNVCPGRITKFLDKGGIVVVTGFQGVGSWGDVTTLGRGGSDATAVLLAAALGTETCEILTDVDGVHAVDPRLVPNARKLSQVSYLDMLRMAEAGAKVLQLCAVQLARDLGVPLHVRSSFTNVEGTRIGTVKDKTDGLVLSVAYIRESGKITVLAAEPDGGPALTTAVLDALDSHGIPILLSRAETDRVVIFVDRTKIDSSVRILYTRLIAHVEQPLVKN